MELLDVSLVDWSRAQFAMTAMYHWLFVPLTLGLGVLQAIMETIYVKTGKEEWKKAAKFWMTVFGINFAIGVATGIILEFQFGTNWSNYSWFVGDIFGAPLAIEGVLAFFMEATFISIMYFGWNKVSKGWHLAATWLTIAGATISALWILVANAWMQLPLGMEFNPATVRNEMIDFWSVLGSPVAINKFFHAVTSGWVLAALFVVGVSSWYLLKKREIEFAKRSIKVAAIFGLISTLLLVYTGDGSSYQVAQQQPMKLAAMEGLYKGQNGAPLIAIGFLNPAKQKYNDGVEPVVAAIKIPKMLSFLGYRDFNAFVPGIADLIDGGYTTTKDTAVAIPFAEKKSRGIAAINALKQYKVAEKAKDSTAMATQKAALDKNFPYFGYGYLNQPEEAIPNVPMVFYSFHLMVLLGFFFIALFIVLLIVSNKQKLEKNKWLLWISLWSIPLGYLAGQLGWIVAEVGRQPWAIQDVLPVQAAISSLQTSSVQITFFLFLVLFTALLIAEVGIMLKQIKKGPAHN
ncbi:MAG: cytochrome bd quinol oxidase subunit 1 apoprotein [Bacteroidetes bacterium]|nr:cytochrome bd quinol oxidase subunit 1 apoprotein [Bacteroidota bacterium]